MKRYKYYILAGIFAIFLTILQIFISRSFIEKDKGYVFIAERAILKGEHIKEEDVKRIQVYGISSTFTIDENKICINDIQEGTILANEMLCDMPPEKDLRVICLPVDKSRCPFAILSSSDTINVFIMPDNKSISIYESAWLDKVLKELGISYDSESDIGFMIENLEIADLGTYESSNYSISIKVPKLIDKLFAFIKGHCTIEIILP
ncbi:MAG: hypothetical protein WC554_04470 [Clostridia bacterium]|nr:hypothetical protein [Clostridia bacterium]NLV33475.1 hypothetical protein [Clostridiaceae bacterium]HQM95884.1 hypothetical protein [Clostridia bacterium]HQO69183.1 hypothetical protein [Clostridia bacterium]